VEHFQAKPCEMLHTGEKPYACTVCEKKSDKKHFKGHEKNLLLVVLVIKSSWNIQRLSKQHEMIHTIEKPSVLNKNWSFFKRLMI
jgi:hypothetical protein